MVANSKCVIQAHVCEHSKKLTLKVDDNIQNITPCLDEVSQQRIKKKAQLTFTLVELISELLFKQN